MDPTSQSDQLPKSPESRSELKLWAIYGQMENGSNWEQGMFHALQVQTQACTHFTKILKNIPITRFGRLGGGV